jgi:ABC-type phosphate/phosphonate transport system substrate-binding protein
VRKQSRAKKVTDFKGQIIAMPPADSAMDRLGRLALIQVGLTPGRDVTISYRPSHDSCLREVQRGAAAACVTTRAALRVLPAELTRDLRAIGTTDTVPGVAFLAHQRLPAGLRDRLQAEILSWKDSDKGRTLLTTLGFGTFVPVNPADYKKLTNVEAPR